MVKGKNRDLTQNALQKGLQRGMGVQSNATASKAASEMEWHCAVAASSLRFPPSPSFNSIFLNLYISTEVSAAQQIDFVANQKTGSSCGDSTTPSFSFHKFYRGELDSIIHIVASQCHPPVDTARLKPRRN